MGTEAVPGPGSGRNVRARAIGVVLSILTASLTVIACKQEPRTCRTLPAGIVWGKDQSLIRPGAGTLNVWEGWAVRGDHFEAGKNRSRFVFWRSKGGSARFRITYSLSPAHGLLMCNEKQVALPPAGDFTTKAFDFKVKKGFNFLETVKQAGDTLKIREIGIGEAADDGRHLREGEHLVEYFPPGEGSLLFSGRGTLVIEKAEAREGGIGSESRRLEASRSRRDLRYDFRFSRIGYLKISATQGAFDILRHEFREQKAPPPPPPVETGKRPDVFVFAIDACQAKHLSTYGYPRKTSPSIDALARDGVLFENAYANATFTPSSVATILTGLYPERHSLKIQVDRLPEGVATLPEFMRALGYRTAVFSSSINVAPRFGFSRGVDDFVGRYIRARPHDPRRPEAGSAPPIIKDFLPWLDGPEPRFAYLHFMEPHWPLLPPPPFLDMFMRPRRAPAGFYDLMRKMENGGHRFTDDEMEQARADYDSDIAYIDFQLGETWRAMRERGRYDESVIVLLSDHGEAFFEHGQVWSHGTNVFDETTHVPLIIKLPKSLNIKGRVSDLAQLVDVFPTIAGLFGKTPECDGRDALALLGREPMDDTFAISRSGWFTTGEQPAAYSLRWKNWYYILDTKTRKALLYQLDGDPARDVLALNPRIATLFEARFIHWYRGFPKLDVPLDLSRLPKMSPEEIEVLRSLGYL